MKVALKNWFLRQPLLLPTLSLATTIYLIDSSESKSLPVFLVASIFILSALCSRKVLFLCLLLSITGGAIHQNQLTDQQRTVNLISNLDRKQISIYGIIDTSPRTLPNETLEATIKVIHCPHPGYQTIINEKFLGYLPNYQDLDIGEKVWLQGSLTLPSSAKNPGVFDKRSYLHRQGISALFYAENISNKRVIAKSHQLASFAQSSRQWIKKQLISGIEDTEASEIILAMFLGEKPVNDSQIINDFKNSGTIHVFAVSGLHVMMIGAIFTIILKLCHIPSSVWIPIVIIIMFFYAIVTGMRPPAMRASIMGTIVLTATLLLRNPSLPSCLWLSAIIALLWDTHSLFLPGFQLSYIVLATITYTGKWWMDRYAWINRTDPFMPESLLNKRQKLFLSLRKKTSASLAVSTSAWSGSSILIWIYFGIITPLAIIASLPLMLFVFLLLGTCCASLILGSFSQSLGEKINYLNTYNATAAHKTSRFFAFIPNTRYHAQTWSSDERVTIYHLEEGGGVYISLGGGILLDAGNSASFRSQILPGLKRNGATLDTLIASHSDIKHIQGLSEAIKEFPIKQILVPNRNSRSVSHKELVTSAQEIGIKIIPAINSYFPIEPNIGLEVIHIPSEDLPLADDRCHIFMLHWHDKDILFLNDSGHYFNHWIRHRQADSTKEKLTPDVIVIGKHAKSGSLHSDIIDLLKPEIIIATQTFYPAEQSRTNNWINQVKQRCSKLYLLNESGAVTITQNNNKLQFETVLDESK